MAAAPALLALLFVCAAAAGSASARNAPLRVPQCAKETGSKFAECVRNVTEMLQSALASGFPSLGIPAPEPLEVPLILLRKKDPPSVCYKLLLQDVDLFGLSNFHFDDLREKGERLELALALPLLRLNGRFTLSGSMLGDDMDGRGRLDANFTKSRTTLEVAQRGAKKVDVVSVTFHFGEAQLNFHNRDAADHNTTMVTNMFLNENTVELVAQMRPALEAVVDAYAADVADAFAYAFDARRAARASAHPLTPAPTATAPTPKKTHHAKSPFRVVVPDQ